MAASGMYNVILTSYDAMRSCKIKLASLDKLDKNRDGDCLFLLLLLLLLFSFLACVYFLLRFTVTT